VSEPTEELHEDLRTTSEHVALTAERIKSLEAEKRSLAVDDPRVLELSTQIEELAAGLAKQVSVETELAKELQQQP
jgi:hypothetical protein